MLSLSLSWKLSSIVKNDFIITNKNEILDYFTDIIGI